MGSIILGKQQNHVFDLMKLWWKSTRQLFELAGLAGTGKSTIIKIFTDSVGLRQDEVLYCSFTGKATQLLNMKGLYAKTIHASFYEMQYVGVNDDDGNQMMLHGRPVTERKFIKRDEISPKIRLIVIDEAGACGSRLAVDVLSFGVKVMALGDLHQLPPVMDKTYFLKRPDFELTEIMRQAEGDPIIYLSQCIIHNKPIDFGSYGKCNVIEPDQVSNQMMLDSDIILAPRNKTRDEINTYIKSALFKRDMKKIFIDDKIISRQNNWNKCIDDIYFINGLLGYVEDVHAESWTKNSVSIDFRPDFMEDNYFENVIMDLNYFRSNWEERRDYGRCSNAKIELAWCISVYLSQGSEYDNVLFYDEEIGTKSYIKQTEYTAVTRAKEAITIVKQRPRPMFFMGGGY